MSLYIARQDGNGFRTYFTTKGTFDAALHSKHTMVLPEKELDKALAAAAKMDALVLTDTQKSGEYGLNPV